jgi:hypothetical protein
MHAADKPSFDLQRFSTRQEVGLRPSGQQNVVPSDRKNHGEGDTATRDYILETHFPRDSVQSHQVVGRSADEKVAIDDR